MASKKKTNNPVLPGIQKEMHDELLKCDRPIGMPCLEVIAKEVALHGLPFTDAEYIYDCWLANGYCNGRGRKIRDWKAAIRLWKASSYFPSQRSPIVAARNRSYDETRIERERERARRAKNADH
jgi:hypothetical protein